MKFLIILFPIIATALAASIPLETSTVVREPLLTNSVPVAADDKQSRNANAFNALVTNLNLISRMCKEGTQRIINMYLSCVFTSTNCPPPTIPFRSENTTAKVDSLKSVLEQLGIYDMPQINGFDESFAFSPVSSIAKVAVNPNNQKRPLPVTVPTFWNPYVNVPYVAYQNEMPNAAQPSAGSFIPYLNNLTPYSGPSFMNTLAQYGKGAVPADTFLG